MIFKDIAIYAKDYVMASEAIAKLNKLDGTMVLDKTYLDIIKGLNEEQAKLALSTTKLSKTKQQQLLIDAGISSLSEEIVFDKAKECIVNSELNDEIKESIIKKMAEASASNAQADGSKVVSREKLKEIIVTSKLNEEEKEAMLVNLGYGTSNVGLATTFSTLTTKIWGAVKAIGSFLFTNPVGWCVLATGAIAGVVIGYNAYIKKIHEAAEEARKSIDEIKSSYDDLSSSVNDAKTRYAELAQEVGNLGKLNQNAGTLSTDEYEEFLDLSNQLSELFPQLTKGYDDNGNAILNLSGNVNTIVGSLNDLVKVQKDLANQEIIEKMPKVWDGYALDVKEYQKEINKINDEISEVSTNISNQSSWYKTDNSELNNALKSAFEKSGITNVEDYYQRVYNDIFGYTGTRWDFSKLSDEQIAEIKQYWDSYAVEYQKQANDAQKKIDANNIEMKKYFSMWFSSDSAYGSETDPEKNQIMQYLMSSFDLGIFQEELDGKEWDEVTEWIEDNILFAISNVDKEDVENALLKLLSGDYDSYPELEELYSLIQSYFKPDNPIMLYFKANYGSLNDSYNTVTDNAAKKFAGVTDNELDTNNINSGTSAKVYQENYKKYQEEKQALDDFARENKINTQDQIAFWNQCIKESKNRDDAMKKYLDSPFGSEDKVFQDIFAMEDANGELNILGQFSEQLDKIQSAYQTLSDTIEHYNNTGHITIDQFQEIIEQGDDFLDYLTLEDGQLGMNEQAMYDLAEARIVEMKAKMISNIIDSVTSIENETQALSYLESTNYELADSYEYLAKAKITAWATEMATSGDLSQEQIESVTKKAESDIEKINALAAKIDITSLGGGSGSGGGSSSEYDWKNLLDKEIAVLEKQLDAGLIDFDTYLGKRLDLIEKYYQEGKIKAEDYYDYLEKTYENQLSIYDRVISAVTNKLEKQIEQLEKQKAVIEEGYQLQIDKLNEEIELLEKEYQKKKDLEELEQARYNAEKARNQRIKKLYTGDNFTYVADDEEVRNAEEELADKELQMNISRLEEQIESLEKEMEEATKLIDEQIEKLQEYIEQWNDVADTYEEAQNEMLASQVLGAQWEAEILALRQDVLEQFKNEYVRIQEEMANAALKAAEAQLEAEKLLAKGGGSGSGSGGAGGSGGNKSKDESESKSHKWEYRGKVYDSFEDAEKDAENYAKDYVNKYVGNNAYTQDALEYYINKEKNSIVKYAKGGVIKKSDNIFSPIAESIGEDTMVAVRDGERVLTPIQNKHFEKLISISDKLVPALLKGNLLNNNLFGNLQNNNMPYVPATANSINISIGDINLHEVNDVNTLSQAIISQLPNKISQAINRR